jgi:hypothetical protein
MIFFFVHLIVSPAVHKKRLRAKAAAKLFISAVLFLYATLAFHKAPFGSAERFFFLYLLVETVLDIVLFSALLYSGYHSRSIKE